MGRDGVARVVDPWMVSPAAARGRDRRAEPDDLAVRADLDFGTTGVSVSDIAASGSAVVVVAGLPDGDVGLGPSLSGQVPDVVHVMGAHGEAYPSTPTRSRPALLDHT